MGATTKHGLPYPEAGDPANVPLDIQELANAVDGLIAVDDQGTLAARPVSTPGSPGKEGRYYWATDTSQLFRDHGTGWTMVFTASPSTPLLETFPTTGNYDGREVNIVAPEWGRGPWRFRYNANSSPDFEWDFVSGAPLRGEITAPLTTFSVGYTSQAGDTPLPKISGRFEVKIGARIRHDASAFSNVTLHGDSALPSDTDSLSVSDGINETAYHSKYMGVKEFYPPGTDANSRRIFMASKVSAGTATITEAWYEITPQRCQILV